MLARKRRRGTGDVVMTISLFTYGTLEIPAVLEAVTGRTFPSAAAMLPGHARFLLRGRVYPGIIRDVRSRVTGVLYTGVDADSLALLDRFEDDFYRREAVRVQPASGCWTDAAAYVVPPAHSALLSALPWDRAAFVARHLEALLRDLPGHHASGSRAQDPAPGAA